MIPTKCAQCGAVLDPLALACPYCRLTTPAGVAAQRQAEQQNAAQAAWHHHARAQAAAIDARQLESAATHALLWSLGGLLCCVPASIVGIVQAVRARRLASRNGMPVPPRATLGLIVGVLGAVFTVGGLTWAGIQDSAEQDEATARIAALEKTAAKGLSSSTLDHVTACALAEAYTLKNGWASEKGHRLDRFECSGKLTSEGDRARLEDFRFRKRTGDDAAIEITACFKRGGAWYVSRLAAGSCDDEGLPPKSCTSLGQSCEIAKGKLGVCVAKEPCDGAGPSCLVCQSQH